MTGALCLIARWPRATLVAGLVAGILLPGLARAMAAYLPWLVGGVMFLGALRLGPADVLDLRYRIDRTFLRIGLTQLALPLAIVFLALATGTIGAAPVLALVIWAAAPPIVSSANIAGLLGLNAGRAMQLMLIGTLALPVTVVPVLLLVPAFGTPMAILSAALRLFAIIAVAGGGAMIVRRLFLSAPDADQQAALDGASVAGLAIFVIALMPAVSNAAIGAPFGFLGWLGLAFLVNFGAQIIVRRGRPIASDDPLPLIVGNRNIALFFAALPAAATEPLLVFLGCYQLPMLLSPILLRWLYRQ